MQFTQGSTCGLCDFSAWQPKDIRLCAGCGGHLCMPLQAPSPRSVCSYCIVRHESDLETLRRGSGLTLPPTSRCRRVASAACRG